MIKITYVYVPLSLRVLVLQVDQHDEEDEEEGLFLQQICHHKVTGERLTTIKLNNGILYSIIKNRKINDCVMTIQQCSNTVLSPDKDIFHTYLLNTCSDLWAH